MKVGDRVFTNKLRNHGNLSGFGIVEEIDYVTLAGNFGSIVVKFDKDYGQTRVCHKEDLVLEYVYNSKLYKSMK